MGTFPCGNVPNIAAIQAAVKSVFRIGVGLEVAGRAEQRRLTCPALLRMLYLAFMLCVGSR